MSYIEPSYFTLYIWSGVGGNQRNVAEGRSAGDKEIFGREVQGFTRVQAFSCSMKPLVTKMPLHVLNPGDQ